MKIVEPFQVLLIAPGDRQPQPNADGLVPLQLVATTRNSWRSALSNGLAPSFAAVVVGCEKLSDVELLPQVLASWPGPLIAVGPANRALAEAACAAGAVEYLARTNDYWQSLYLAIKCAHLTREVEQVHVFKDQFISTASHELKNPLAALRGYSELLLRRLQRSTADERVERGLQTILQQALRMQHILDDLHDLARIQRSGIELQNATFELEPLLERTINQSERTSCTQHVALRIGTPAPTVYGDSERLQRVLSLLICISGNHSPAEVPVEVSVNTVDHHGTMQTRIAIQSYSGLQHEEVEQAFVSFYPRDNATAINATERLGLYVGSEIARLHHGQLGFRRTAEGDSLFELTLPQQ